MSLQADPEDMPPNDMEAGSGAKRRTTTFLSDASRKYDVGNKGFLDEDERAIREYDTNNDGNLDINEIKHIVRDLKDNNKEKRMFKKLAVGATGCLAIVLLANSGLVWATLVLTRQLESQDGALVDTSTGKKLSTQARGNNVEIVPTPEYAERLRRLLETDERRLREGTGEEVDVRRLTEETIATLKGDKDWAAAQFQDYINGIDAHFSIDVNVTTFTGEVVSGVFHTTPADGCEMYGNIQEVGAPEVKYEVRCCGSSNCTLHHQDEASTRRFLVGMADCSITCLIWQLNICREQFPWDGTGTDPCGELEVRVAGAEELMQRGAVCFSPLATVNEKVKGKMFLKDLKYGDLVLAAGGTYRPFLTFIHTNPSKPTKFFQIHTDSSEDAPLEATSGHLVFLEGKDLPVPASEVKVGDRLVGKNAPLTVEKITSVIRDGLYSPLTSDATHFVDGILASSMAPGEGEDEIVIGPFSKVHVHTLFSRVIGPLTHHMCSKVNIYFCSRQVEDDEGGHVNVVIKAEVEIAAMHPAMQAILTPFLIATVAACLISYYLGLVLVPSALVVGCFAQLKNKKVKTL